MNERTIPVKREESVPATRDETRTLAPAVDIIEIEDGLRVVADIPGVPKDSVEIQVENDILTIKAVPESGLPGKPVHTEYETAEYFRHFHLGEEVDVEKLKANVRDGVLTIELPRAEASKPRKIAVSVE